MKIEHKYFRNSESGNTLLESLLAIAVVAIISPFIYMQVRDTSREISDLVTAKKILEYKSPIMNFARMNYDKWGDNTQIILSPEDIKTIAPDTNTITPYAGFVDKYKVTNTQHLDIYLAFRIENSLRSAKLAKNIGSDAGSVTQDGIAYNTFGTWGVVAKEFKTGDLVYKITADFIENDSNKFLHKTGNEKNELNKMHRDLYFSGNSIFDIAKISAKTVQAFNLSAGFVTSKIITADTAYFPNGANIQADKSKFNTIKTIGDITGFRNINTSSVSGVTMLGNWSSGAQIIADRADISGKINVSGDMSVKSASSVTLSDFINISTHSIYTSYANIDSIYFTSGYGLTISSELLSSTKDYPLKIGSWTFPSTSSPTFNAIALTRFGNSILNETLQIPSNQFSKITKSGWKGATTK